MQKAREASPPCKSYSVSSYVSRVSHPFSNRGTNTNNAFTSSYPGVLPGCDAQLEQRTCAASGRVGGVISFTTYPSWRSYLQGQRRAQSGQSGLAGASSRSGLQATIAQAEGWRQARDESPGRSVCSLGGRCYIDHNNKKATNAKGRPALSNAVGPAKPVVTSLSDARCPSPSESDSCTSLVSVRSSLDGGRVGNAVEKLRRVAAAGVSRYEMARPVPERDDDCGSVDATVRPYMGGRLDRRHIGGHGLVGATCSSNNNIATALARFATRNFAIDNNHAGNAIDSKTIDALRTSIGNSNTNFCGNSSKSSTTIPTTTTTNNNNNSNNDINKDIESILKSIATSTLANTVNVSLDSHDSIDNANNNDSSSSRRRSNSTGIRCENCNNNNKDNRGRNSSSGSFTNSIAEESSNRNIRSNHYAGMNHKCISNSSGTYNSGKSNSRKNINGKNSDKKSKNISSSSGNNFIGDDKNKSCKSSGSNKDKNKTGKKSNSNGSSSSSSSSNSDSDNNIAGKNSSIDIINKNTDENSYSSGSSINRNGGCILSGENSNNNSSTGSDSYPLTSETNSKVRQHLQRASIYSTETKTTEVGSTLEKNPRSRSQGQGFLRVDIPLGTSTSNSTTTSPNTRVLSSEFDGSSVSSVDASGSADRSSSCSRSESTASSSNCSTGSTEMSESGSLLDTSNSHRVDSNERKSTVPVGDPCNCRDSDAVPRSPIIVPDRQVKPGGTAGYKVERPASANARKAAVTVEVKSKPVDPPTTTTTTTLSADKPRIEGSAKPQAAARTARTGAPWRGPAPAKASDAHAPRAAPRAKATDHPPTPTPAPFSQAAKKPCVVTSRKVPVKRPTYGRSSSTGSKMTEGTVRAANAVGKVRAVNAVTPIHMITATVDGKAPTTCTLMRAAQARHSSTDRGDGSHSPTKQAICTTATTGRGKAGLTKTEIGSPAMLRVTKRPSPPAVLQDRRLPRSLTFCKQNGATYKRYLHQRPNSAGPHGRDMGASQPPNPSKRASPRLLSTESSNSKTTRRSASTSQVTTEVSRHAQSRANRSKGKLIRSSRVWHKHVGVVGAASWRRTDAKRVKQGKGKPVFERNESNSTIHKDSVKDSPKNTKCQQSGGWKCCQVSQRQAVGRGTAMGERPQSSQKSYAATQSSGWKRNQRQAPKNCFSPLRADAAASQSDQEELSQSSSEEDDLDDQCSLSRASLPGSSTKLNDTTERWVLEHLITKDQRSSSNSHTTCGTKPKTRHRHAHFVCSHRSRSFLRVGVVPSDGSNSKAGLPWRLACRNGRPASLTPSRTGTLAPAMTGDSSCLKKSVLSQAARPPQPPGQVNPWLRTSQHPPGVSFKVPVGDILEPSMEVVYNAPKTYTSSQSTAASNLIRKVTLSCLNPGSQSGPRKKDSWAGANAAMREKQPVADVAPPMATKPQRVSVEPASSHVGGNTKREGDWGNKMSRSRSHSPRAGPCAPDDVADQTKTVLQGQAKASLCKKLPLVVSTEPLTTKPKSGASKIWIKRASARESRQATSPVPTERKETTEEKMVSPRSRWGGIRLPAARKPTENPQKKQKWTKTEVGVVNQAQNPHGFTKPESGVIHTPFSAPSYAAAVLDSSWPPSRKVAPELSTQAPQDQGLCVMSRSKTFDQLGLGVNERCNPDAKEGARFVGDNVVLSASQSIPDFMDDGRMEQHTRHRCSIIRQYIQDKYACLRHTLGTCHRHPSSAVDYKRKLQELLASYYLTGETRIEPKTVCPVSGAKPCEELGERMAPSAAREKKVSIFEMGRVHTGDTICGKVEDDKIEMPEPGSAVGISDEESSQLACAHSLIIDRPPRLRLNPPGGMRGRDSPIPARPAALASRAPAALSIAVYDSLISDLKTHYLLQRLEDLRLPDSQLITTHESDTGWDDHDGASSIPSVTELREEILDVDNLPLGSVADHEDLDALSLSPPSPPNPSETSELDVEVKDSHHTPRKGTPYSSIFNMNKEKEDAIRKFAQVVLGQTQDSKHDQKELLLRSHDSGTEAEAQDDGPQGRDDHQAFLEQDQHQLVAEIDHGDLIGDESSQPIISRKTTEVLEPDESEFSVTTKHIEDIKQDQYIVIIENKEVVKDPQTALDRKKGEDLEHSEPICVVTSNGREILKDSQSEPAANRKHREFEQRDQSQIVGHIENREVPEEDKSQPSENREKRAVLEEDLSKPSADLKYVLKHDKSQRAVNRENREIPEQDQSQAVAIKENIEFFEHYQSPPVTNIDIGNRKVPEHEHPKPVVNKENRTSAEYKQPKLALPKENGEVLEHDQPQPIVNTENRVARADENPKLVVAVEYSKTGGRAQCQSVSDMKHGVVVEQEQSKSALHTRHGEFIAQKHDPFLHDIAVKQYEVLEQDQPPQGIDMKNRAVEGHDQCQYVDIKQGNDLYKEQNGPQHVDVKQREVIGKEQSEPQQVDLKQREFLAQEYTQSQYTDFKHREVLAQAHNQTQHVDGNHIEVIVQPQNQPHYLVHSDQREDQVNEYYQNQHVVDMKRREVQGHEHNQLHHEVGVGHKATLAHEYNQPHRVMDIEHKEDLAKNCNPPKHAVSMNRREDLALEYNQLQYGGGIERRDFQPVAYHSKFQQGVDMKHGEMREQENKGPQQVPGVKNRDILEHDQPRPQLVTNRELPRQDLREALVRERNQLQVPMDMKHRDFLEEEQNQSLLTVGMKQREVREHYPYPPNMDTKHRTTIEQRQNPFSPTVDFKQRDSLAQIQPEYAMDIRHMESVEQEPNKTQYGVHVKYAETGEPNPTQLRPEAYQKCRGGLEYNQYTAIHNDSLGQDQDQPVIDSRRGFLLEHDKKQSLEEVHNETSRVEDIQPKEFPESYLSQRVMDMREIAGPTQSQPQYAMVMNNREILEPKYNRPKYGEFKDQRESIEPNLCQPRNEVWMKQKYTLEKTHNTAKHEIDIQMEDVLEPKHTKPRHELDREQRDILGPRANQAQHEVVRKQREFLELRYDQNDTEFLEPKYKQPQYEVYMTERADLKLKDNQSPREVDIKTRGFLELGGEQLQREVDMKRRVVEPNHDQPQHKIHLRQKELLDLRHDQSQYETDMEQKAFTKSKYNKPQFEVDMIETEAPERRPNQSQRDVDRKYESCMKRREVSELRNDHLRNDQYQKQTGFLNHRDNQLPHEVDMEQTDAFIKLRHNLSQHQINMEQKEFREQKQKQVQHQAHDKERDYLEYIHNHLQHEVEMKDAELELRQNQSQREIDKKQRELLELMHNQFQYGVDMKPKEVKEAKDKQTLYNVDIKQKALLEMIQKTTLYEFDDKGREHLEFIRNQLQQEFKMKQRELQHVRQREIQHELDMNQRVYLEPTHNQLQQEVHVNQKEFLQLKDNQSPLEVEREQREFVEHKYNQPQLELDTRQGEVLQPKYNPPLKEVHAQYRELAEQSQSQRVADIIQSSVLQHNNGKDRQKSISQMAASKSREEETILRVNTNQTTAPDRTGSQSPQCQQRRQEFGHDDWTSLGQNAATVISIKSDTELCARTSSKSSRATSSGEKGRPARVTSPPIHHMRLDTDGRGVCQETTKTWLSLEPSSLPPNSETKSETERPALYCSPRYLITVDGSKMPPEKPAAPCEKFNPTPVTAADQRHAPVSVTSPSCHVTFTFNTEPPGWTEERLQSPPEVRKHAQSLSAGPACTSFFPHVTLQSPSTKRTCMDGALGGHKSVPLSILRPFHASTANGDDAQVRCGREGSIEAKVTANRDYCDHRESIACTNEGVQDETNDFLETDASAEETIETPQASPLNLSMKCLRGEKNLSVSRVGPRTAQMNSENSTIKYVDNRARFVTISPPARRPASPPDHQAYERASSQETYPLDLSTTCNVSPHGVTPTADLTGALCESYSQTSYQGELESTESSSTYALDLSMKNPVEYTDTNKPAHHHPVSAKKTLRRADGFKPCGKEKKDRTQDIHFDDPLHRHVAEQAPSTRTLTTHNTSKIYSLYSHKNLLEPRPIHGRSIGHHPGDGDIAPKTNDFIDCRSTSPGKSDVSSHHSTPPGKSDVIEHQSTPPGKRDVFVCYSTSPEKGDVFVRYSTSPGISDVFAHHSTSPRKIDAIARHSMSPGKNDNFAHHSTSQGNSDAFVRHSTPPEKSDNFAHHSTSPGKSDVFARHSTLPGKSDNFAHHGTSPGNSDAFARHSTLPGKSDNFAHHSMSPGNSDAFARQSTSPGNSDAFARQSTSPGNSDAFARHSTPPEKSDNFEHHSTSPGNSDAFAHHSTSPGNSDAFARHSTPPGKSDSFAHHSTSPGNSDAFACHSTSPGKSDNFARHSTSPGNSDAFVRHSFAHHSMSPGNSDAFARHSTSPGNSDAFVRHSTPPGKSDNFAHHSTSPGNSDAFACHSTPPRKSDSFARHSTSPANSDAFTRHSTPPGKRDNFAHHSMSPGNSYAFARHSTSPGRSENFARHSTPPGKSEAFAHHNTSPRKSDTFALHSTPPGNSDAFARYSMRPEISDVERRGVSTGTSDASARHGTSPDIRDTLARHGMSPERRSVRMEALKCVEGIEDVEDNPLLDLMSRYQPSLDTAHHQQRHEPSQAMTTSTSPRTTKAKGQSMVGQLWPSPTDARGQADLGTKLAGLYGTFVRATSQAFRHHYNTRSPADHQNPFTSGENRAEHYGIGKDVSTSRQADGLSGTRHVKWRYSPSPLLGAAPDVGDDACPMSGQVQGHRDERFVADLSGDWSEQLEAVCGSRGAFSLSPDHVTRGPGEPQPPNLCGSHTSMESESSFHSCY